MTVDECLEHEWIKVKTISLDVVSIKSRHISGSVRP